MGNETYEAWIQRPDDSWERVIDTEAKSDLFTNKKRAFASVGTLVGKDEDIVKGIVVERRLVMELNGFSMLLPPNEREAYRAERKARPVEGSPALAEGGVGGNEVRSVGAPEGRSDGAGDGRPGDAHPA